jgi:hypothetical protein
MELMAHDWMMRQSVVGWYGTMMGVSGEVRVLFSAGIRRCSMPN